MKKIVILLCIVLAIFAIAYFIIYNNQEEETQTEDKNFSIRFTGEFTPEELEKIMSENLSIEELKSIVGEENIEINTQ